MRREEKKKEHDGYKGRKRGKLDWDTGKKTKKK